MTVCFFGEGAVAEGEFHESLNLATLWHLPIIFCCENNFYAMGTALGRSEANTDLVAQGRAYGLAAWSADGMDVQAVEAATRRAVHSVARRRRARVHGDAHLPLPRPLDVRP